MSNQSSQNPADASPVVYLTVARRTLTTFQGKIYEDIDDWVHHYERVVEQLKRV